ncbi:hypothetical protein, partial [Bordetella pertussis]|uniref:hypothetical protein n=1 Tax=Bordetella pertussis TaxID=520 RepID=UPI0021CC41B4
MSTAVSPATDPPAQLNSVSILPKCSTARRTACPAGQLLDGVGAPIQQRQRGAFGREAQRGGA